MEGIRSSEIAAIQTAVNDLGSIDWELVFDSEERDKDEWKEYNRVASAFVEPCLDPDDEDHFCEITNIPGWTIAVAVNIEFPSRPVKFKEFLTLLEKLGY